MYSTNKINLLCIAGRTRWNFCCSIFAMTKSLRSWHQLLADFSRPTENGQYQAFLKLRRHVNRLKSAD